MSHPLLTGIVDLSLTLQGESIRAVSFRPGSSLRILVLGDKRVMETNHYSFKCRPCTIEIELGN